MQRRPQVKSIHQVWQHAALAGVGALVLASTAVSFAAPASAQTVSVRLEAFDDSPPPWAGYQPPTPPYVEPAPEPAPEQPVTPQVYVDLNPGECSIESGPAPHERDFDEQSDPDYADPVPVPALIPVPEATPEPAAPPSTPAPEATPDPGQETGSEPEPDAEPTSPTPEPSATPDPDETPSPAPEETPSPEPTSDAVTSQASYAVTFADTADATASQPVDPAAAGPSWVLPADRYRVSSEFGVRIHPIQGVRKCHLGTDFAAAAGTPLKAASAGTIASTGAAGGYGNLTVLALDDGTELWYAHQETISVTVGQRVTAGEVIGTVGSTGNSTGPHLHFEVHLPQGVRTDPRPFLEFHGLAL